MPSPRGPSLRFGFPLVEEYTQAIRNRIPMSGNNPPRISSTRPATDAFAKNAGLGFAIPYLNNGQQDEYVPDFIVRIKAEQHRVQRYLILETKGFDPLEEVKTAANRWANAVKADGRYGHWSYRVVRRPERVRAVLDQLSQ
jgi:hypothetical protein